MATGSGARRRVTICGGSIMGLLAGNLFHRMGWDVHVYERTAGVLEGRGAGITVLPGLVEGFEAAGVPPQELGASLGVDLPARVALDRAGNIVVERWFSQVMTSWSRLYELLKAVFPPERYHAGATLEYVEQDDAKVTACFADGRRVEADLLIGADGLRSTVRSQMLPDAKPHYAGYVAWRCLADENELKNHGVLLDRYAVCVAPGEQGIAYPVPGPGNATERGKRQYNVVWYHPVTEEGLRRLMTDEQGRYHANGIPPGLLRDAMKQEMADIAGRVLAPQFAEAVRRAKMVFFQPIMDLEPEHLAFGRVVIVGDGAFIARPHTAMGIPKGAGDVTALVRAVKQSGPDFREALPMFEAERLRIGRLIVDRGRRLGSYMEAQLKSEAERAEAERLRVPEEVMMETAKPVVFE